MQQISRKARQSCLTTVMKKNKISWNPADNSYNKRWAYKWKNAWYTYLRDSDPTQPLKPQDSKDITPMFNAWLKDFTQRMCPALQCVWDRRHRCYDHFQLYALPAMSLSFYQFWDTVVGFKVLTVLPLLLAYVRVRDKTLDPDFKETYLRDMLYSQPEVAALFKDESIHVLDYDCEYDRDVDVVKFPEYNNKTWQFFNTDTSMTTGHFRFGDLESGATMNLKFKTMPASGKFRYQVGEPFYFYDLRAEIVHEGVFKEVVLVDENVSLKKMRPFLFLI